MRVKRYHTGSSLRALIAAAVLLFAAGAAAAQDQEKQEGRDQALANLAERLAEKRSQVESLTNELELAKTDYNERLRSLATQKADVEAQIKRQELKLQQINQDLEEYRTRIEQNRSSMEEIKPVLSRILMETKSYIRSGLPFKVQERLKEVQTLERLMEEGSMETGKILARTWNLLESEFRMTAENGLYKQTIRLQGEKQLAEVARLGMTLMYFKTLDGKYGYVVPAQEQWKYRLAKSGTASGQIATLFESLHKNLREGYFTLPNPMSKR